MHMRTRMLSCFSTAGLLMAALFLIAAPGQAIPISPGVSGVDMGLGCDSAACFPFNALFTLDGSGGPVTGSFDIVNNDTFNFSIDVGSTSLSGSDGAVTGVVFSDVTYSGSVPISDNGATYGFIDQQASVSGLMTPVGAGSPVAFNLVSVNVSGICEGDPGVALTCGLTFGGSGFPLDVNGNTRYFQHTVDATGVIPEPGTALLMGLGLTLLSVRRRSA